MSHYRYKIFKVAYPADRVYPLHIYVPDVGKIEVKDLNEFIEHLKTILNSDRVRNTIRSFVDMQRPQPPELEIAG
jgi:hypothetical protein